VRSLVYQSLSHGRGAGSDRIRDVVQFFAMLQFFAWVAGWLAVAPSTCMMIEGKLRGRQEQA
jgi:hypothetical protein